MFLEARLPTVILFLIFVFNTDAQHWTYEQQDEWPDQCVSGQYQSPIEIFDNKTVAEKFDPLIFTYYNVPPQVESLTNNGHSITFKLKSIRDIIYPKVLEGGLTGVYQFEQLHFHWGEKDERGSEHSINGMNHPMEMHIVHFNTLYGSNLSDAMRNSDEFDTIAVVGVMFEISEEDNPHLDSITEQLANVRHQNDVINDVQLFALDDILPANKHRFYRYNGSLTTPPCSEIVVWTIFKDPVYVSEKQLNKFRAVGRLPMADGKFEAEGDNFRDHQPLDGRVVLDVATSYFNLDEVSRFQVEHSDVMIKEEHASFATRDIPGTYLMIILFISLIAFLI